MKYIEKYLCTKCDAYDSFRWGIIHQFGCTQMSKQHFIARIDPEFYDKYYYDGAVSADVAGYPSDIEYEDEDE